MDEQARPLPKTDPRDNLFFDAWDRGGAVKDPRGVPQVLMHGTTHDFDAFGNLGGGNAENYLGRGFYFTNNTEDLQNYSTEAGADLRSRVERVLDQLRETDIDPWDAWERYGKSHPEWFDVLVGPEIDQPEDVEIRPKHEEDVRTQMAWDSVAGKTPRSIPVYLRANRWLNMVPGEATQFSYQYDVDEQGDMVPDSERGTMMDLYQAILNTAEEYQLDGPSIWSDVAERLIDGIDAVADAHEISAALRDNNDISNATDWETGDSATGEFIADVFRNLGYDGIVMDAYRAFGQRRGFGNARLPGMQGVEPGTRHYVVWDPANIKSALGNEGFYNPEDKRLTASAIERMVRKARRCDRAGHWRKADALDRQIWALSRRLSDN